MISVLFICHGNICRSTMAQFVFQHMVNHEGLSHHFIIDSRAVSREEIGNPPHPGTIRKMSEKGIPVITHYAQQITMEDYDQFDYIIGMDSSNISKLIRMTHNDPSKKIYKLLNFTDHPGDIADPWYTGDFETTYRDVKKGCIAFLRHLQDQGAV